MLVQLSAVSKYWKNNKGALPGEGGDCEICTKFYHSEIVCGLEQNICKVNIFVVTKYKILKTTWGADESTLCMSVITTHNSQIPEDRTLQFAVSQEVSH